MKESVSSAHSNTCQTTLGKICIPLRNVINHQRQNLSRQEKIQNARKLSLGCPKITNRIQLIEQEASGRFSIIGIILQREEQI